MADQYEERECVRRLISIIGLPPAEYNYSRLLK
jgi:hypothetical protein